MVSAPYYGVDNRRNHFHVIPSRRDCTVKFKNTSPVPKGRGGRGGGGRARRQPAHRHHFKEKRISVVRNVGSYQRVCSCGAVDTGKGTYHKGEELERAAPDTVEALMGSDRDR